MARRLKILVFPLLLALTMQLANHARDGSPTLEGRLVGIDGYTHLMRAGVLMTDGGWFDRRLARGNPPAGDDIYWPRPYDLLLIAGALPFLPFVERVDALYFSGVIAGPLLHLAALVLLIGIGRRYFDGEGQVLLGIVFALGFFVIHLASIGRPDHHALLLLLFVWQAGAMARLLAADAARSAAFWAALPAVAGLWISLEALVATGLGLAALGLGWILSRGDFAARAARHALWLTAGAAVALAIEHGTGALDLVVYDALSLPHLTLLAGAAAAISVVARLDRLGGLAGAAWRRALLVALAILLPAGLVAWLFPAFLDGPYAAMSEESIRRWALEIAEMRPMLDPRDLGASLPGFVFHLGAAILALPVALHHALRGPVGRRREWAYLAALGVVFVVFTAYQQRWGGFAQVALAIPHAALILACLARADRLGRLARPLARAGLTVGLLLGFPILGLALIKSPPPGLAAPPAPACPLTETARWLESAPELGPGRRRLVTHVNFAPEILYRTPHEVIATPNHRNWASIMDSLHALESPPDAAREILDRRGVDLLLVCLGAPEARELIAQSPDGLVARIAAGRPPSWLSEVDTPFRARSGMRLYTLSP